MRVHDMILAITHLAHWTNWQFVQAGVVLTWARRKALYMTEGAHSNSIRGNETLAACGELIANMTIVLDFMIRCGCLRTALSDFALRLGRWSGCLRMSLITSRIIMLDWLIHCGYIHAALCDFALG